MKFLVTVLLLCLSHMSLAGELDERINHWRQESAVLKASGIPTLEEAARRGDLRSTYLLYAELGKTRYGYAKRESAKELAVWIKRLADKDDPLGQRMLGYLHLTGEAGVEKDERRGYALCQKSAGQGMGTGMFCLGYAYDSGTGVDKSDAEAVKWYRKAAEAGDSKGMTYLGAKHELGQGGLAKGEAEAVKWYRKAAEAGKADMMVNLGTRYLNGQAVPKDDSEALKWYRKAADLGDGSGMVNLGWMYESGRGVTKDEAEAVNWYRKAADAGNARAMNQIAEAYFYGKGLSKDYDRATEWYRKAAKAGNVNAMSSLAWMFNNGKGVEKNGVEAVKWYRQAAEAGDTEGMVNLAARYVEGLSLEKNDLEAVKWFRKAAAAGNGVAIFSLGWMYENGRGVDRNDNEAIMWYRKAAEAGEAAGMTNLGVMYENGRGAERNDEEALKWYRKAANKGEATAMRLLGRMFERGKGVAQNEIEAMEWYRKAADLNDAEAMNNLGLMYEKGKGVAQSTTEAVNWFSKAAKAGDVLAMGNLGGLYLNGKGVEQSYAEAAKWFHLAAEKGSPAIQTNLGVMYLNGQGVPQNNNEAFKWLRKAAEAGDVLGMVNLGTMYDTGKVTPQNYAEAFKWHHKAAEAGNAQGMNNLAVMYINGLGVEKNNTEAVKWLRRAAKLGNKNAIESMRKYDTDLAAQQQTNYVVPQATVSIDIPDGYFTEKRVTVLRQLAKQGNGNAMYMLGWISWTGQGVEKNRSTGLDWYKKAASAKNAGGLRVLGMLYRDGPENYPKDANKAAQMFLGALTAKQTRPSGQTDDSDFERLLYKLGTLFPQSGARNDLDELLAAGEITDPDLIRQVKALSKPAPKLDWVQIPKTTDQEEIELRYRITDQGGGIGDIQIKVNDVAVGTGQGRDVSKVTLASDKNVRSVRLKLAPGEHDITVLAYNGENLINWSEIKTRITSTFKPVRKPQLHAVVVGIDEYGQDSLKLRYAVADARAMAEKLRSQGPKLYDRVSLKLLDTKGQTGKRAILDALESVKKDVHPEDLFVFYVAAHGIYEEPAGYYMLTSDVKLKSAITQDSLSADDLHRAIGGIGAQKKLILLDTCHSGRGLDAGKLIGKRGLDDMLMVKRLNRKSGAVVLAAAESQEQALEGFEGHGLFTYAVLEALSGKADTDKDDWISTAELQGYVEKRTLELSEKLFKVGQSATPSTQGSFEVLRVK